jgi:hypothetical protein
VPTSVIAALTAALVSAGVSATIAGVLAYATFTIGTMLVLNAVSGLLTRRPSGSSIADQQQARSHVIRSGVAARTVIYGTALVSGPLIYCASSPVGSVSINPANTTYTAVSNTVTVSASGFSGVTGAAFTSQVYSEAGYYFNTYPLAMVTGAPGPGQFSAVGNVITLNAADVAQFGTSVTAYYNVATSATNQANGYLHVVVALAGHEVQGIDEIYLNDQLAVDAAGTIQSTFSGFLTCAKYLGTSTQTADTNLMAAFPGTWTSAHLLQGVAYVYLRLQFDQKVYPNGVPNMRAVVRGKKVFDPRTATSYFSNNWALCVRDYLTSDYGLGTPVGEIDDATFISAANSCDELVPLNAGGSTQVRYTCDGVVDLVEKPLDVMKKLMTAGVGTVVYTQGKYRVAAGVYTAPAITLTEKDLRDKVTVQPALSLKDTYNAVRGTFVNKDQFWQTVDFPPVTNATYQAADGGVQQFRDIELPFTIDATRAQRIGKVYLEKSRQSIVVQFPAKFTAFKVAIWDRVYLSLSQMGWTNKIFLVTGWKFADTGVDLVLQEDASASYDWNYGNATTYDPAPNTNLPVPGYVPTPSTLTLTEAPYVKNTTIVNRVLAQWNGQTDAFVQWFEVQYSTDNGVTWNSAARSSATTQPIDNVPLGLLTVRVRGVSYTNNVSSWRTGTITVRGKVQPPPTVSGFTATLSDTQLLLAWTKSTDVTVAQYEVRTSNANWGTAGATFKGDALSLSVAPPAPGASVTYYIKALDLAGNYSTAAASVTFTATAVPNVAAVASSFYATSATSSTVTLSWTDVTPQYGLGGYQVAYGATTRTVKANSIALPADWIGDRTFTVKTVDALGNLSSGYLQIVTKLLPASPGGFQAQVVDNNVMLYWTQPAVTTLPVSHYFLKKGATWATATDIGRKDGLFTTIFENAAGTYTYWVATVDTDGNYSTPVSLSAVVSQPPDFVFFGKLTSTLAGTLSNAIVDAGVVVLPVNTAETFAAHFTSRTWSTPADQVTAGYPVYIQPTPTTSGYYEETFDFGTIVTAARVSPAYTGTTVAGAPTVAGQISTSPDNVTWTTYSGLSPIYATSFRYVKVRVTVTDASALGVYTIANLTVTLDAKLKDDAGVTSCLSTDTSGTVANFGVEFIDVTSVSITPAGTTPVIAVYDYLDAVINGTYSVTSNVCTVTATAHGLVAGQKVRLSFSSGTAPSAVYTVASVTSANVYTVSMTTANTSGNVSTYSQGMRIYLFNTSGTRVSGTASWAIRGY